MNLFSLFQKLQGDNFYSFAKTTKHYTKLAKRGSIKKFTWISFTILFGIVFLLSQNFFAQANEQNPPELPELQLTKSIDPQTVFPDGTTRVTLELKGTGKPYEKRSPVDVMHTIDTSNSMNWYANLLEQGQIKGTLQGDNKWIKIHQLYIPDLVKKTFDVLLETKQDDHKQYLKIKSPSGKEYGYRESNHGVDYSRLYPGAEYIKVKSSKTETGTWEFFAKAKEEKKFVLAIAQPPIRIDAAKEAAKHFIDIMQENDQIGVVSFNRSADNPTDNPKQGGLRLTLLDDNRDSIKNEISKLRAGGATAIGKGLEKAINEFDKNGREHLTHAIILLTDGVETECTDLEKSCHPLNQAQSAKDKEIIIYTIGFGEADENLLKEIAERTGGKSYHANNASELEKIYNEISQEFSNVVASKTVITDILPDYIEYAGNASIEPDEIIKNSDDGTTTLIWNLNKIKIGDEFSVSFDVKVHKESGKHLVNEPNSRVDFYNYLGKPDSKEFPEVFVNVISEEEPYIFKANNPDGEVSPGNEVEFTLTYGNNSDSSKTFDIVDTWSFLTDVVASYVEGSATSVGEIKPVIEPENKTISWKDIELPAKTIDQILKFKLRFHQTHLNEGTFTLKNIAAIIFNGEEYQSNETINTVTYEEAAPPTPLSPGGGGVYIPPVKKYPDLMITKTDSQEIADPGQILEYSITYANIGDTEAKDVKVIDFLPDFVNFLSASNNGIYDQENNQVVWNLGNILAGVNKILNLKVEISSETPAEGAVLTNKVEIETTSEDLDLSNNKAEDITNVGAVKGAEEKPEGKVEGEEVLPEAGVEFSIIYLIALIGMGMIAEINERFLKNEK